MKHYGNSPMKDANDKSRNSVKMSTEATKMKNDDEQCIIDPPLYSMLPQAEPGLNQG